jgi:6-pyruvoyl-tetrahydropterin synthase related domain
LNSNFQLCGEETNLGGAGASSHSLNTSQKDQSKLPPLRWVPLLVISATAFAAEIPFFFFGTPSGHDVEFHLYSWLEVLAQWKQGIFLPRWAAMAHFAYGEPRFIFYPPASWTLGGLLSAILPWTLASPVYIWTLLVLAGVSMFALARRWLGRRDAIFAAALYAVNPYHIVIVYWRSAFAELLASCWLPLLVLMVLKASEENDRRIVIFLSLIMAGAWLTNAPAAVMIHYSLAVTLLFLVWHKRSSRLLIIGAVVVVLGACLSAFYLLPAIYEQRWVNIGEAISAGSRPQDNFLFARTTDADHDAFNRIISWVAMTEMVVTLTAAWAAKKWRADNRVPSKLLLLWAVVCSLLMFPVTGLLWRFLPKLEFMQFPWRWLLCLSLIFSIFLTVGVRRWWMRASLCVLVICVIVIAWARIQAPWWDRAADLREMRDNMADAVGYEGTDEYTPVGADPAAIDKDAWKAHVDGTAHAAIHVFSWNAESKSLTAQMSAPDRLALRLFCYPAWRAEVNGSVVATVSKQGTGQMLVPLEAGMNRVEIRFVRTWDRTLGGWISIFTCLALMVWSFVGAGSPLNGS